MYKAVLNFLRGQVLVHIESGCPERVVNLCAGAEVPFWDVRWLSPVELTLRTTRRGLAQCVRRPGRWAQRPRCGGSRGLPCWPGGCGGGMCCWRAFC